MAKKTSADYQRAFRQRLREQGLKKKEIWIRPEHEKLLAEIEEQLRYPSSNMQSDRMIAQHKDIWQVDILCQRFLQTPLFTQGYASAEYLESVAPSILVTMHDYGDLPIYVAIAGEQILVESVLWRAEIVNNHAAFNRAILETHKYFPLSTISLEHTHLGDPYYSMFGALASTSNLDDILLEIETLARNVIYAIDAYHEFLPPRNS